MSEQQQSKFEGWARVEAMGHNTHIGFVRTEVYGAAVLFRVDQPGAPERDYVLERPEMTQNGTYAPAGSAVKRLARDPVTVLIGAGSIYRMIPCTEEAALLAIEREQRAPLMLVSLPGQLPAPNTGFPHYCEDCGKLEQLCDCEVK